MTYFQSTQQGTVGKIQKKVALLWELGRNSWKSREMGEGGALRKHRFLPFSQSPLFSLEDDRAEGEGKEGGWFVGEEVRRPLSPLKS